MKRVFFLLLSMALSVSVFAEGDSRSLIVYYSQSGTTEKVAKILQQKTNADIEAIETVVPYSGSIMEIMNAVTEESKTGSQRDLKPMKADVADYDTIYIGYPIWGGTYAAPIASFLKDIDLEGKIIVPFCTFGSGGNTSIVDLHKAIPDSEFLQWYGVRSARIDKAESELDTFLKQIGAIKGEIKKLSAFSEPKAITDADKDIFDKACGSYPMPLGTPVNVCSRPIEGGTEYLFTSRSKDMSGKESTQRIYVVKGNGANDVPEFTQVER